MKIFCEELVQRAANAAMQLLGLYAQLREGSKWVPLYGQVSQFYLNSPGHTLLAGTSEIQRNVIAIRGLGLPRG